MVSYSPIQNMPYPAGSDPVGQGDDVFNILASRLDLAMPRCGRSGPHNVAAVDTNYTANINFPDPFTAGVVPVVTVTAEAAAPTCIVTATNITNTGFTLNYRRISGTVNVSVMWSAQAPQ